MALDTKQIPLGAMHRKLYAWFTRSRGLTLKSVFIFISIAVIALGNWNNARAMVVSVYAGVITHFTDRLEHELLSHVRVGSNLGYIESLIGHARVIRPSATNETFTYRYYFNPKFLLALAVEEDQVIGYQLSALKNGFLAEIPLIDKKLNSDAITDLQEFSGDFSVDNYNATFYLESRSFGREGMFYQLHLGFTEYSNEHKARNYTGVFSELMDELVQGDEQSQIRRVETLRRKVIPNVYTIGKLSLEQASEMLMTRYEVAAHL